MHPDFNEIESCLAFLDNSLLTHHLHVHYLVLPLFDHTIVSMWVLYLWCQGFLNNLISLVSLEVRTKDNVQDRSRQALLDFIDLYNQKLIFHGQYFLKNHSDVNTFSKVLYKVILRCPNEHDYNFFHILP